MQHQTALRLSLRALFGLVTFTCLSMAGLASALRGQPATVQKQLLTMLSLAAIVNLAYVALCCLRRRKVEQQSGQLRLRPLHAIWPERMPPLLMVCILALLFGIATFWLMPLICDLAAQDILSIGMQVQFALMFSIWMGCILHGGILLMWKLSFHSLEICEHGIIIGAFHFLPWQDLRYHLQEYPGVNRLELKQMPKHRFAFVHDADMEQVQTVLDQLGAIETGAGSDGSPSH